MGNLIKKRAKFFTASELSDLGKDNVPDELTTGKQLVYSSPATLCYNSPGAEGYGVKRAGLSVPESVMLIVAPGCCGRNTSIISNMPQYRHRFFYLEMNENDLVTGKHLSRIPKAIKEICNTITNKWGEKAPSVVMICITCVDALLGTDMERVCRKAEEFINSESLDDINKSGSEDDTEEVKSDNLSSDNVADTEEKTGNKNRYIQVKPCYMYALTREGHCPPMVQVRQSIYSLLDNRTRKANSVNILGHFDTLIPECELYDYLKAVGVKNIREIGACDTFDEFMKMSEASFNIILNPEAVNAGKDLYERLKMPFLILNRLYYVEQIHKQYMAFAKAIGVKIDDGKEYDLCKIKIEEAKELFSDYTFSIGEALNADSFELALALIRYGFKVDEIFAAVEKEKYIYIDRIAELSPDTKIYSNMEPTMVFFGVFENQSKQKSKRICIGKDASYYHKDAVKLMWNEDIQPFGYMGVIKLFNALKKAVAEYKLGGDK
ncbi:MAG: nitrogenase component 1 [Lachnospiraceae bacterium]|nr:nitrogenase component 1 [Lachnospiraceae bacterium]